MSIHRSLKPRTDIRRRAHEGQTQARLRKMERKEERKQEEEKQQLVESIVRRIEKGGKDVSCQTLKVCNGKLVV